MLRLENLKKAYGERVLFSNVTFHFPERERLALVGPNGAGKTTLLNLLCGLDQPDDGRIVRPNGIAVGYLPQKPNPDPEKTVLLECAAGAAQLSELKEKMDRALTALTANHGDAALHAYEDAETAFRLSGGYALEAKSASILRGLGFSEAQLAQDPKLLSGGWRMRVELARLFIREPEFLVLDEPTNHLDLPSLVWVEEYLTNFRGTLLFVSHDRALLNRLSTMTLHLAGAKMTHYTGNFDAFLDQREARLAQEQAAADQLRRRREQMERFVQRFGAKATKAAQAQSRVKMIARIRDAEGELQGEDDESTVTIPIPGPPKAPRIVLQVEGGAIGYDHPLASGINLSIERGAKIAIIGANGIGKSTLLRTIAGRLQPLGGAFTPGSGVEVSYFAQEQSETLDPKSTVLQNLLQLSHLSEREARSLLGGFLFRGNDVFKPVSVLSGGEASRVGLASALAQRAALLLLDEPTNHLDMGSVETLAASLDEYEGTVLMVSHDRTFIDAVATHIFAMLPDGRSMLFPGKLADYARLAAVAGFPNVLAVSVEGAAKPSSLGTPLDKKMAAERPPSHSDAKEQKRLRQKLSARVEKLDGEMGSLREKLNELEATMSTIPGHDYGRAQELHAEQNALRARLESLEGEWLQAAEELEKLKA